MQMGLVSLGKMGASMAMKLCRAEIHVVGFDADGKSVDVMQNEPGFDGAYSLDALLNAVSAPRMLWLMLPAGEPTERVIEELLFKLTPGDLVVLYTDGISEAMNTASDLFGDQRLSRLVEEHGHLESGELRERILREIEAFVGSADQHDDMTMILLKVNRTFASAGRVAV